MLTTLLLAIGMIHFGKVNIGGKQVDSIFPIEADSCSTGKLLRIYLDIGLEIPMPNPLLSDRHGEYVFFTSEKYAKIVAIPMFGDPITMEDCPKHNQKAERKNK